LTGKIDPKTRESPKMKKMNVLTKNILGGLFALAQTVLVWVPVGADAADQKKGAEYLIHLQGIKTKAEAEALKPGDTIAMICSKCKTAMIHNISTEKGHIQVMTVGAKHLCPGCDSTIKVVGVGHGAKDVVKHVCEKCGEDSVFCCATKPGSAVTAGMEKMEKK
jgi:hypothetical protein